MRKANARGGNEVVLALTQLLLGLAHLDQRLTIGHILPEIASGLNHVQRQMLQIAQPFWLRFLNLLEYEIFDAILWIRYQH